MTARELRALATQWNAIALELGAAHAELVRANPPMLMLEKALHSARAALDIANRLDEWAMHEECSQ